jgi:hypothetical protein
MVFAMNYPLRRISIPVSQVRLTFAVITAVSFGFLIYLASFNVKWLIPNREFLIIIGVFVGLLFGWLETRTVTHGLNENQQILVWQILLSSAALIGLPLILAATLLDRSDFLPFAGYLFLPAMPAFSFLSGWRFWAFERKNNVQIKMLSFGYFYYAEPVIVDSNRFSEFLSVVASKDASALWQQIGYAKKLVAGLRSEQDLDASTRRKLLGILDTMRKYQILGLSTLAIFLISTFSLLAPIFTDLFGVTKIIDSGIMDILMPAMLVLFVVFGIAVFLLVKTFNLKISKLMV